MMDDDNPRPSKRPRRNLAGAATRNSHTTTTTTQNKPAAPTKQQPASLHQIVHFVYAKQSINELKEPWQTVAWECHDAFSELLYQWRADIMFTYPEIKNIDKFSTLVEISERRDDEKVEIVYRVKKPNQAYNQAPNQEGPTQYLGHIRYRGEVGGGGTIDIVTRGFTIDFPDAPAITPETEPQSQAKCNAALRKRIRDPRLEKAILTLMDDGKDHLHRVRIITGHHEWSFKFDNKPVDFFLARQHEVDAEEAEYGNQTIQNLETEKGPSSEARPWEDTLLLIGEPAEFSRRERVYDSYGRFEMNKWARVSERDFRSWTRRALFLFYHDFKPVEKGFATLHGVNWCWTKKCNLILDDRFCGKLFYNGLQLCRWELAASLNQRGFRYGYDMWDLDTPVRPGVLSLGEEAKIIATVWNKAVSTYGKSLVAALSELLKSVPPYRDSVLLGLNEATRDVLRTFLTVEGKTWYIPALLKDSAFAAMKAKPDFVVEVLPDSYWSLLALRTPEEEEKRRSDSTIHVAADPPEPVAVPRPVPDAQTAGAREIISLSPAASTRTTPEHTNAQLSTEPSTEPSLEGLTLEPWATDPVGFPRNLTSVLAAWTESNKMLSSPKIKADPVLHYRALRRAAAAKLELGVLMASPATALAGLALSQEADEAEALADMPVAEREAAKGTRKAVRPNILWELVRLMRREAQGKDETNSASHAATNEVPPESTRKESSSTELLANSMTVDDNILMQRIQKLEAKLQEEKERNSVLMAEMQKRSYSITNDMSTDTPMDVVTDDSAEERVFPVPSGYFPSEVMRLVQACLKLCPGPWNMYTCLPIEGGTGVVVAGFCRFDHDQRCLKIHKDWLSLERMRQYFGSQDETQTDLLCHTVHTLWEDLLRSEPFRPGNWSKCRGEIRRRLLDYRQVCRQITVPGIQRKSGEIAVVTSALATSGWARATDEIHLSVHHKGCPWANQTTRVSDPRDRHFSDITEHSSKDSEFITHVSCDSARSCHGVVHSGPTRAPVFMLRFQGLETRRKFFVVAKNLSQPDSLTVILDGYHSPLADEAGPLAASWSAQIEKSLRSYIAMGCLFQPLLLDQRRGHEDPVFQRPSPR